jgi:hypothetical protein
MLLQMRIATGRPYTYQMGACWDREGTFTTAAAWEAWVAGHRLEEAAVGGLRVSYE